MKAIVQYVATVIVGIVFLAGSAAATEKDIAAKSKGSRTDVFSEVKGESAPPKGFVNLLVRTSIKSYPEGHFAFESTPPKDGYAFVLNVDGQGALWKVDGQKEATPAYDKKSKKLPEGGKGTRFTLEKKIRLAVGTHKIFLGLPEEGYSTEAAISLAEGAQNVIEFKPVYKSHRKSVRHFAHGLSKYEVFLNGKKIK
ncbi:MAG: hypothetical protein AB1553_12380 [Nitrospirota bacterium]